MRLARRLLAVVVFVGLLVAGWQFADSNAQLVPVHYPGGAFEERALWVVLLVAFGCGVSLAALIAVVRGAQLRLISRRYRKLTDSLQAEVHQLRSLPLSEEPQTLDSDSARRAGLGRGS
jgi:uncharacterized integral membrane protein